MLASMPHFVWCIMNAPFCLFLVAVALKPSPNSVVNLSTSNGFHGKRFRYYDPCSSLDIYICEQKVQDTHTSLCTFWFLAWVYRERFLSNHDIHCKKSYLVYLNCKKKGAISCYRQTDVSPMFRISSYYRSTVT